MDIDIVGEKFDLFEPSDTFRLGGNSAAITIDSMEQVGGQFDKFLSFLLNNKPRVCIHIEPVYEAYDQDNLYDYLAAKYSEKRGYLRGYLTRLEELQQQGELKLKKIKRYGGNIYHEGWAIIVWERS